MRIGGGTTRKFLTVVLGALVYGVAWCAPGSNTLKAVVVAEDGSGDYRTVGEAIAAAPSRASGKLWVIRLKPGTYHEKLRISHEHAPITLLGENPENTVIVNADCADDLDPMTGARLGIIRSATVRIDADDFTAENVTFANDHKPAKGEGDHCLAVYVTGDRSIFRCCRMLGWKGALCLEKRRQYLERCYIAGQTDFIAGGAETFFESCEIHCVATGASITAAATPAEQPYGFVFHDCRISAEPGVKPTHLGRPWRPAGSVTWLSTEMTEVVTPQGWAAMDSLSFEKTARFTEYRSSGPGAKPGSRAKWSRQLTDDEARHITVQNVLSGHDGWAPVNTVVAQP